MIKKRNFIVVTGLLLLALAFRFIFSASSITSPDSALYLQLADKLKEGKLTLDLPLHIHNIIQPGYSMVVYLANAIIHNTPIAGLAVSFVSGLVLVIIVYFFGKDLFDRRVGLLAAVVVAIHPYFVFYSTSVLTESLFALLTVAAAYLFHIILSRQKPKCWYILLGLLIGFAYLVRVAGLFMLGAVIVWLLILILQKKLQIKKAIISALLLVFGALLIAAPYLFFLYKQTGHLVLTGAQDFYVSADNSQNGLLGNSANLSGAGPSSLTADLADYTANQPAVKKQATPGLFSSVVNYGQRLISHAVHNIVFFTITFFVPLILAVYGMFKSKNWLSGCRNFLWLFVWAAWIMVLCYLGRPVLRYYLPVIPLFIIMAAAGMISLTEKLSPKTVKYFTVIVITGGWLVYEVVLNAVPAYLTLSRYHNFYLTDFGLLKIGQDQSKILGEQIKKAVGTDQKILSKQSVACYYAQAVCYPLPQADKESILSFARAKNVNYLLLNSADDYTVSPGLSEFFNFPDNSGTSLVFKNGNWHLMEIKSL